MATTVDGSTGVSQIQDDKVTVDKLNLISTGSVPSLEAKGTSGVTSGYLKLNCSENSHGIKLLGPPHSAAANYTLTFPNNDGDASQFLQTNGSGVMSWAAAGGGVTHLGTLTTTSGTSQALAAQNFSLYNQIWIVADNVSSGGSADFQVGLNGDAVINTSGAVPAASGTWAWFKIDLRTNVFNQTWLQSTATTSGSGTFDNIPTTGGYYNLGTNYRAVTSGAITIAMEGQTFDAGSAEIYGVS